MTKRILLVLAFLLSFQPFIVHADNSVIFRGQVDFEGSPVSAAEVYFLNPSGGNNQVQAYTDNFGHFEVALKPNNSGGGWATISILVPSTGKPKVAIGNFIVAFENNMIKYVRYDGVGVNDRDLQKINGLYLLSLKNPTVTLRLTNEGAGVPNPTLEPNGYGTWPWLKGNESGFISLYVKSCLMNCFNYGFFNLVYPENQFNVVKVANGFAVRINSLGIAEVKDQFSKPVSELDGVFNLELKSNDQMLLGSKNVGVFPNLGPLKITNFVLSSFELSPPNILGVEFDLDSSKSMERFEKPGVVKVALRNIEKTYGLNIEVLKKSGDLYNSRWAGNISIPNEIVPGKYKVRITINDLVGTRVEQESVDEITITKINKIVPSSQPTSAPLKSTITCIKGKLTKKVTAVKPICPKGYKKK